MRSRTARMTCRMGSCDLAVIAGEPALVLDDLEHRLAAAISSRPAVWPHHLVDRSAPDLGGEALDAEILGVPVGDRVDQPVSIDDSASIGLPSRRWKQADISRLRAR